MADDFDSNKPEEQGATGEDFMQNEDIDREPAEPEEVDGAKCPECGSSKITRMPMACCPDDYIWQYECMGCGATWEL